MAQFKVIETKYIGPTNNRGARIKAFDSAGNALVIGYPYELDGVAAHLKGAEALRVKMGWPGELLGGWSKNGCAFVLQAEVQS